MKYLLAFVLAFTLTFTLLGTASAGGHKHNPFRGSFFRCTVLYWNGHGKHESLAFVREVRSESQTLAPEDALPAVTDYIEQAHDDGCLKVLSIGTHARVNDTADDWYDAVLADLGY